MGRLRLLEGRARAADRDPRRRAAGPAHLPGRSGRHEHADAPGCLPRRGHLRSPAARGERAGPAAPARIAAGKWTLRGADVGGRSGAGDVMTTALFAPEPAAVALPPAADRLSFHLPPELEAHEPPEARGLRRDGVRLLVSYRSDDRVVHATFRDLPT